MHRVSASSFAREPQHRQIHCSVSDEKSECIFVGQLLSNSEKYLDTSKTEIIMTKRHFLNSSLLSVLARKAAKEASPLMKTGVRSGLAY